METKGVLALLSVFIFCCSNVYFLEVLIREDPGIGNLITFLQFVFISIHGFIFTSKFGTAKRFIPMKMYISLVLLFFFSSVANNYAFNFNIPMPLHMIFRSGSLMANMVLGVIILDKKYSALKYVSVILITLGIIVCTIETGTLVRENSKNVTSVQGSEASFPDSSEDLFWWLIGVTILTISLFLSARMGLFQETLYQKYGKYPWEALYYTHIMPLPLFAFIYPSLWNHWVRSGQSEPYIEALGITTTRLYLLLNTITQCFCVGSVYVLTTECTSLTVTLTVTLRKFLSLIFSIIYFQNPFTPLHWLGTLCIFIGTLIFTELLQKLIAFVNPDTKYSRLEMEVKDVENVHIKR